jgi:hypothetical protein
MRTLYNKWLHTKSKVILLSPPPNWKLNVRTSDSNSSGVLFLRLLTYACRIWKYATFCTSVSTFACMFNLSMSWDYTKCPTERGKCFSILNTFLQLLFCTSADEINRSAVVGPASPALKECPRADDINCFRAIDDSPALCRTQLCIK